MTAMSPLRRRMIEDMTIRNLSYAVAKFSRHFKRSPDRLGIEEVRAYQLHLIEQKYSWTHINQVACALRFFYGITLGQKEAFERTVSGREPERLRIDFIYQWIVFRWIYQGQALIVAATLALPMYFLVRG